MSRGATTAIIALAALVACEAPEPSPEVDAPGDTLTDTLTTAEQRAYAVDPLRYPEMREGRLDTVDMLGETEDASWHIQAVNYSPRYIAMTYATWYTGAESLVMLAADGQPHLEDDLGNVYPGITIPGNPRFKVESGTTAVGVYVFRPALNPGAASLTLFVNDSTAPVLRIGPFGVRHDAIGPLSPLGPTRSGIEVQAD